MMYCLTEQEYSDLKKGKEVEKEVQNRLNRIGKNVVKIFQRHELLTYLVNPLQKQELLDAILKAFRDEMPTPSTNTSPESSDS